MLAVREQEEDARKELLKHMRERNQNAEKIKQDLAEAHKEYFEIVKLRRQDQEENFNRHRNLE